MATERRRRRTGSPLRQPVEEERQRTSVTVDDGQHVTGVSVAVDLAQLARGPRVSVAGGGSGRIRPAADSQAGLLGTANGLGQRGDGLVRRTVFGRLTDKVRGSPTRSGRRRRSASGS
ncbi:hypothetical protein [Nocardioides sp. TF02-7]|uniref:hypothetical protein n=1 Tax=Nocardioides sp. TF02-7 TaxID=2917724 RepID=UPI001F057011|nr:hypothetical protein [Nocardioides sp. TF02-7]UMG91014.1 hypothetical protein MF408_12315 [Nocardioides sp. TF02-7]